MPAPNPDTLKPVKDFSRPGMTFAIARLAGTPRVFLGSSDFSVSEADLSAAKPEAKPLYSHGSYVTGVTLAGKTLVSGGYDGRLVWWDTDANRQVRADVAHEKWVRKVAASPDGKLVASVADDMACKVWDAGSGKLVHDLRGHKPQTPTGYPSMLFVVAFSPDGRHLATADKVGHVVVWDVTTGKQAATLEAPALYTWDPKERRHSIGGVRSLAFSPDGKRLAVGGISQIGNIDHLEAPARVEVFDWTAGKREAELTVDKTKAITNKLAWAPDGSWLLAAGGGNEGFLAFFDGAGKKLLRQDKPTGGHVHDFWLSPAADELVLATHSRVAVYKFGA